MLNVAKCEPKSTINVKIDAICEQLNVSVKIIGYLIAKQILTLNVKQIDAICEICF